MALLLVLANLLAVISGGLLVVLAITAKPTRGENLLGFHRVTTPRASQTTVVRAASHTS